MDVTKAINQVIEARELWEDTLYVIGADESPGAIESLDYYGRKYNSAREDITDMIENGANLSISQEITLQDMGLIY